MNIGVAAGQYKEPAPQNPIPASMTALGHSIHELGMMADTLVNRLETVLMPSPPAAETKGTGVGLAAAAPLTSPAVEGLQSARRRIDNIAAQLQHVLNRLEV